jgi:hypothetical protein
MWRGFTALGLKCGKDLPRLAKLYRGKPHFFRLLFATGAVLPRFAGAVGDVAWFCRALASGLAKNSRPQSRFRYSFFNVMLFFLPPGPMKMAPWAN